MKTTLTVAVGAAAAWALSRRQSRVFQVFEPYDAAPVHRAPGKGVCAFDPPASLTSQQQWLQTYTRTLLKDFAAHLQKNHADNKFARMALRQWSGYVAYHPGANSTGVYYGARPRRSHVPCIGVKDDRYAFDDAGRLDKARVNAVVLHELAHAAAHGNGHGDDFKEAVGTFYRWATEELGWPVDVRCTACQGNGFCSSDLCPKCGYPDGDLSKCPKPWWTRKLDRGNRRTDFSVLDTPAEAAGGDVASSPRRRRPAA